MSNLFIKPKNKKETPQQLKDSRENTLYSFYLNLAESNHVHPINVIFAYVSPKETNKDNILPKLKSKIKEAKQKETMFVGILTEES